MWHLGWAESKGDPSFGLRGEAASQGQPQHAGQEAMEKEGFARVQTAALLQPLEATQT